MKLTQSRGLRIIAGILFFVTVFLAALSGICIILMVDSNVYSDGGVYMREDIARLIFQRKDNAYYSYAFSLMEGDVAPSVKSKYDEQMSRQNTNLAVTVTLTDDKNEDSEQILLNSYKTDSDYQYKFTSTWDYVPAKNNHKHFKITAYLQNDLIAKDAYYYVMPTVDFIIGARYTIIWVTVLLVIFALVMLIFTMCAAGHRKGYPDIFLTRFDKIPADLLCLIYFFGFMFSIQIGDEFMYNDVSAVIFLICFGILWLSLAYTLILSLAVRIKSRTLIKNTLIWRGLKLIFKAARIGVRVLAKIPLYYKTAIVFVVWSAVEFLFLAMGEEDYIPFWVITRPLIMAALAYIVLVQRKLQKAGEELACGNTGYHVDTKYMLSDFKAHGENLNNLSTGLSLAVEERMKSERMKAELITNVSHDIKTPLTAIISYVDLLKSEGLDSGNAPEYLEVLDKQSAKLKKLTEDLIEVSKATSGAVNCTLLPTDVSVLLSQALGEYEERLRDVGIEPILQIPEESVTVLADGKLLWRVFDNLFSNIRKYAMPSTRAYFSCEISNQNAQITFRNISDLPITVSSDELCERFVRGDSSRHTDGSGLGLSIARSLTELQGGTFDIIVDGDLFKAVVTFALCA